MQTFGPDRAECEVFVFREGLLSAVGHDLVLRATAFVVEIADDEQTVEAEFDAGSLRVAGAWRDGRALPDVLSASDRREIETTIRQTVLRADRFPVLRFTSTSVSRRRDGYEVRGELAINGAGREIVVPVRRDAQRLVATVRLHQPDFGIRPYRAMLGALKVRADVVVRVSVPAADRRERTG